MSNTRNRPPRRTSRIPGGVKAALLVVFVLLAATGAGVVMGYYASGIKIGDGIESIKEVFEPPFGGRKVVRILLLGEDATGGKSEQRGLSDTIILASFDLEQGRVSALSIPRDTRVEVPGYSPMKINSTHAQGGPTLTVRTVERLTGVRPDYYVKTNLDGFKDSVDALGGVEIDVDRNMRYTDRRGGLYINLKKGPQHLDGDKAMQYVRFRHEALGDIARIKRQQIFIKALLKKALEPANLPRLPQLVNAVLTNVESDLNPKDAIHLAKFASELDLDQADMDMLPCEPSIINGISYMIADPSKTYEVVRRLFYQQEQDMSLPRVEVLNGSGTVGAAKRVADILMQQGYEVTVVGNADSFDYDSTQIISHTEGTHKLDGITHLINTAVVRREQDASAKADVTVIVGKDWVARSY